jgi:hypothetical protein
MHGTSTDCSPGLCPDGCGQCHQLHACLFYVNNPAVGPIQPPLFRRGWGVELITGLHPVLRFRTRGAVAFIPPHGHWLCCWRKHRGTFVSFSTQLPWSGPSGRWVEVNSTHSKSDHQIQVICQLYALAAPPPGRLPTVSTEQEAGWAPHPVRILEKRCLLLLLGFEPRFVGCPACTIGTIPTELSVSVYSLSATKTAYSR